MQLKKKKRFFTVMIIPHTEESIVSIRIPLVLFQILSIVILLGLLVFFVWVKSYHRLKGDASEIALLKMENRTLSEQVDRLTQETEELVQQIEEIEALSKEICALIDLKPAQQSEKRPSLLAYNAHDDNTRQLPNRGESQVIKRASANISYMESSIPKINEELLQLKEDVEEYQKQMAATPSIWPARGRVTSEFGPRRSPITGRREFHFGIDIAGPRGMPIISTAAGEVVFASYRLGFGNTIIINHGYGFTTVYAHLKSFNVTVGSTVKKGEVLGYMGSTGSSTGTHLHYEVHYRGVAVDPREYLP